MQKVNVSVPAVSTNLGPGYRVLGLALNLRTTIDMSLTPGDELMVEARGEGADYLPANYYHPVVMAAIRLFQYLEQAPAGLHVRCANTIPLGAGLSARTAMIVGGLVGANNLLGSPFRHQDLIGLASDLSGEPEAVVAALRGGLSICTPGGGGTLYRALEPAPMRVIAALPLLADPHPAPPAPPSVPLADAVHNLGHLALLIEALREGSFALLAQTLDDRLHEPYRRGSIPAYDAVVDAARSAGASGVAISGSGPALLIFAERGHTEIADAVSAAWQAAGVESWVRSLAVDTQGVVISVVQ